MRDFDLDVSNPAHRQQFRDMVENMGSNPDQVVTGTFSGGGPTGRRDVLFYVQGNDVVVTSPAGEFVTVLQNGVTNPNVVRALGQ
jgi:filamentous hemagglutinin